MKKKLLFLIACTFALYSSAQDYQITFTGSGASSSIDSVRVSNLTQGHSVSMNGSDILHLLAYIGIDESAQFSQNELSIYPVPMREKSYAKFEMARDASVVIGVYDAGGRMVLSKEQYLKGGAHEVEISGLPSGSFSLMVRSNDFLYSGRIISLGDANIAAGIRIIEDKTSSDPIGKSSKATVLMQYTMGDILLFSSFSGEYNTISTLIPSQNENLDVVFEVCTAYSGEDYSVVHIGTQTWMAENIKTTELNDGVLIQNITIDSAWNAQITPAYCWYSNDESTNKNVYGALYNWYTVNTSKLCPLGWHVPDDTDWLTLETFLGGSLMAGGKLKESGFVHWNSPNEEGTNISGFTALPGGYRDYYWYGTFNGIKTSSNFWSSTEVNASQGSGKWMGYNIATLQSNAVNKAFGYSVRCIKD